MSGLLRRLTRRRSATADETGSPAPASSEPAGAPAETSAEGGGGRPVPAPDEQATNVMPATANLPAVIEPKPAAPAPTARDLPAGVDPSELAEAPAPSANRGKLRRRLRYLRHVRELLLRDLGGFVFEVHRTAGGTLQEVQRRLVEAKASRLAALDAELRALETRLDVPHEATVLREPGIGGLCPECGELHASDAHYCARCGAPLDARARAKRDAAVAAAAQATTQPTPEPAPASVLWAAGPHPRAAEPSEEEKTDPSAATSEWLALPAHEAAPKDAPTDQTVATGSEPAAAPDEAARGDQPKTTVDESAPGGDDPADHESAVTDQERGSAREPQVPEPASENGRRDEDVPPPVRGPLTSRPEQ